MFVSLSLCYLFVRMVFMGVTDAGKIVEEQSFEQNSDSWPGLIIGQCLSELLTSICLLISVLMIYKIELVINAHFRDTCNF